MDLAIFLPTCLLSFLHDWKPFVIIGGNALADKWAFLAVQAPSWLMTPWETRFPVSIAGWHCVAAAPVGADNTRLPCLPG